LCPGGSTPSPSLGCQIPDRNPEIREAFPFTISEFLQYFLNLNFTVVTIYQIRFVKLKIFDGLSHRLNVEIA
jgi:hypothetical protein